MLMRVSNIVRFSHFKSVYFESIKIIRLHVKSEAGVWIKLGQERIKMPLINRLNTTVDATPKSRKIE